jgi:hypothetical protein
MKTFQNVAFRVLLIAVFVLGLTSMPNKDTRANQLDMPTENWAMNPGNGHYYRLTDTSTWQDAETQAVDWGRALGHGQR